MPACPSIGWMTATSVPVCSSAGANEYLIVQIVNGASRLFADSTIRW
jgi:hypothetical protein